ncbi:hypothetical protein BDP55DRAFT_676609 [Colletotrichum godetiae]|uniref:Uncharacterized protein n=1 Tax=Colletotrichum godetiae TaxID=1209918 RepID=A0AAJ0EQ35_9PEZI|nr:uncharacterized protein BDP55DRAFT_676609 [Colletotrichum godetiae]KAK1671182.1 hypothetical protein BDP55DRAFT_676609 [Colletotrichum godetiae]
MATWSAIRANGIPSSSPAMATIIPPPCVPAARSRLISPSFPQRSSVCGSRYLSR